MAAAADAEWARLAGVSPDQVATYRVEHLLSPDHWTIKGRTVVYTTEGERLLCQYFQLPAPEKKEGAAPASTVASLRIVRADYPNTRAVQVLCPEGGCCDVGVKDNRRLAKGQLLECRQYGLRDWECVQGGVGIPRRSRP